MKKNFQFAMMAVMMFGSLTTFTACEESSKDDEPGNGNLTIINVGIEFDYKFSYNGVPTYSYFNGGLTENHIKVTKKGDTYKVEGQSTEYGEEWFEFTFTMSGNKFGPIRNFKAGRTYGKSHISWEADNIVLSKDHGYTVDWIGYDNNGMTVSNLIKSDEYGAGNGYIADPENRLWIDIYYETEE